MEERDILAGMVQDVESDSRGILAPHEGLRRFALTRHAPPGTLGRFIDRIWVSQWDVPAGQTYDQELLLHPVAHLVFTADGATVSGVQRRRSTIPLTGRGRALGVMFRPAGFRAFLTGPMTTLTDVSRPLGEVLPDPGLDPVPEPDDVYTWLAGLAPPDPQPCEDTSELVERVASERTIRRVDELAHLAGTSVRGLQRTFADHVGIGPKWIIRRYRLYDAAEIAARGESVRWAELAVELGYADQAHLVRDFTDAVGLSPDRYARRYGRTRTRKKNDRPEGR